MVLESNTEGLAFALAHGFVEHDRYLAALRAADVGDYEPLVAFVRS